VAYIPAAIGKSTATVTTPGFENPLSSSSIGANFNVIAMVKVPMNTTQAGNFPQTNSANMAASKATINQASIVIQQIPQSIELNMCFNLNKIIASTGFICNLPVEAIVILQQFTSYVNWLERLFL
jgi:hypothetical protein